MPELVIVGLGVLLVGGFALWRPEIAAMALGVFLFIQSALIRLTTLPDGLTMTVERADEIVLAALVLRAGWLWVKAGRPEVPMALWALAVFVAIGLVSAIVNRVGPVGTMLGIFLAIKAGLWLAVGLSLRINTTVLARYAFFIGALFVGVVGIAFLQYAGVPMPWETTPRAGVAAATSIWNQHTAFGGALSVAVGLSVAALRLPGERVSATILLLSGAAGVFLSTARRLLASLTFGGLVVLLAVWRQRTIPVRSWLAELRRPVVLGFVVIAIGIAALVVVPRMANVATYTWQKYVVELGNRDRFQLYVGAYELVRESPFVGRGPATYGSYASVVVDSPAYDEVGFRRRNPSMVVGGQIGSLMAEYGILGFLAFASFLVLIVRALIPIARGSVGTVPTALATGGIFMVANMSVEALVNPVFSNSFVTFFAFGGIGVALTLHKATATDPAAGTWDPGRVSRKWRLVTFGAAMLLLALLVALVALVV